MEKRFKKAIKTIIFSKRWVSRYIAARFIENWQKVKELGGGVKIA